MARSMLSDAALRYATSHLYGVTPTTRRGYTRLANGSCVMAVGDAHVLMDPMTGQGANKASYAAMLLGGAIL